MQANQASTADFIIQPQPVTPHLNFGTADLFGEIKDANGNIPSSNNTVIYARNVFDAPVGLLTAIKAPDGHHLALSEWKAAKGDLTVTCNGNTSIVIIELEGMIPNGTYTLWCNFLNKKIGLTINYKMSLWPEKVGELAPDKWVLLSLPIPHKI